MNNLTPEQLAFRAGYEQGRFDAQVETAQQQEPVAVLPDGSAFAVMSYPLPKDHWLYADRQYNDGEYEPVELGKPVLTHELRDAVVSAVRYAIRGATNCGKEVDFDPDALVKNAVYALCGPFTLPQPAQQQEPVAWRNAALRVGEDLCSVGPFGYYDMTAEQWLDWALSVVTVHAPPASKPWVGLTDDEIIEALNSDERDAMKIYRAIEAKLREKNT